MENNSVLNMEKGNVQNMQTEEQMVKMIKIVVSEKEFENNLNSIAKITERAKNTGKSILLRKAGNKLIMCAGGIKQLVAMVAIDVEGDAGECKGFIDGKDVIFNLSRGRGTSGRLEITFDLSKRPCMILTNEAGKITVDFDVIDGAVAGSENDKEAQIAIYRNEVVEKAYRLERDVQSKGVIQLGYKDFLDIEKSFKHTVYSVAGEKCIEFRIFKEVQKVKKMVEDPNDTKKSMEVWVDEEFPIIEGVGFCDNSMGMCRKYGLGIGPQDLTEMKMLVVSDILNHVSLAIAAMKEEPVMISKGIDGMCVSAGKAKFIFPSQDMPMIDVKPYFNIPYNWKITVDAVALKQIVEVLVRNMDEGISTDQAPRLNNMIIMPKSKSIHFTGIGSNGHPIERYISYEMAKNEKGLEYRDFDVDQIPLELQRKYIKEFLESCNSKKISFGIHTYTAMRNKVDENRMLVKDETGKIVKEQYQGRIISMEDAVNGVYGVHHRVKI